MKLNNISVGVLLFFIIYSLFIPSLVYSEVIPTHPRIWLNEEKMTELDTKACRNPDGSVISGCTPHATWTSLKSWVDSNPGYTASWSNGYPYSAQALVNFAVAYKITKQASYARQAIEKTLAFWDTPEIQAWTVSNNNEYPARILLGATALIFDWCYEQMTPEEQNTFINKLDGWSSWVLNGINNRSFWAHHDSSNNYWYGYLWGLTSAGYALKNHTANADSYINFAKGSMLPEALRQINGQSLTWPISLASETSAKRLYGGSKGGEWSEGNTYGAVNTELLAASLLALKSADPAEDLLNQTSFFDEFLLHNIYVKPPAFDDIIDVGDDYVGGLNGGKYRVALQNAIIAALAKNPNSDAAKYGQFFLDQFCPTRSNDYKRFYDFIWYPVNLQKANYNTLGKDYFAEGMKIQIHRSDWTNNALWFYSRFNQHYSDHSNDGGGGHFSLYKNGWLIKDHAYSEYPGSGSPNNVLHNIVHFPFANNRYMIWGDTTIMHRENTNNYLYYAGDATAIWTSAATYRYATADLQQRSFFYIKDNYLVIYDRANTKLATDGKIWQAYFGGVPSVSGNIVSYYNGGSKVFVKTLLPQSPSISLTTYDGDNLMQVTYPSTQNYNNFLHVIQVADGNPVSMNTASLITSASGNMVGALVNNQNVVMFSENNKTVSDTTYTIYPNHDDEVKHYLTGFAKNNTYHIIGPAIEKSTTSSAEGVLCFTTQGSGTIRVSLSLGQPIVDYQVTAGEKLVFDFSAAESFASGSLLTYSFGRLPQGTAWFLYRNIDISGDGGLNLSDFAFFGVSYNKQIGEPKYNPKCDFNQDGKVDSLDLDIFAPVYKVGNGRAVTNIPYYNNAIYFEWTPTQDQVGIHQVIATATDGISSKTESIDIEVLAAGDTLQTAAGANPLETVSTIVTQQTESITTETANLKPETKVPDKARKILKIGNKAANEKPAKDKWYWFMK